MKGAPVKFLVDVVAAGFFFHSVSDLQKTLQLWRRAGKLRATQKQPHDDVTEQNNVHFVRKFKVGADPPLSSLLFTVLDLAACRGRSWEPITQNQSSPARGEAELGDWRITGGRVGGWGWGLNL